MVSIVLERARTLREYRLDRPVAAPGEVLIRMESVGLLDHDLDAFFHGRGKLPRVFGSSFVGTVVGDSTTVESGAPGSESTTAGAGGPGAAGPGAAAPHTSAPVIIPFHRGESRDAAGRRLQPGTRVAVLFEAYEDGGLREYVAVPAGRCYPIPTELPQERTALLPDVAVAAGLVSALRATPGDSLVVYGARAAGLVLAIVAQEAGLVVTVVDPSQARLHQAETLGITRTINPIAASVPEEIEWVSSGRTDFIVDTSGDPEIMPSVMALAHAGTVLGFTVPIDYPVSLRDIIGDGISVQSLVNVPPDFDAATTITEQVDVEQLVSLTVPMVDIPAVVPAIVRERGTFLRLIGYQHG